VEEGLGVGFRAVFGPAARSEAKLARGGGGSIGAGRGGLTERCRQRLQRGQQGAHWRCEALCCEEEQDLAFAWSGVEGKEQLVAWAARGR
jgi:hypothetical protein